MLATAVIMKPLTAFMAASEGLAAATAGSWKDEDGILSYSCLDCMSGLQTDLVIAAYDLVQARCTI